ncbi:hypothetical protein C8R43DRAFT_951073 [Mycena crocata]|nr:hypothetical protein C8R43DRAFT_951073 [Mycena crocata]
MKNLEEMIPDQPLVMCGLIGCGKFGGSLHVAVMMKNKKVIGWLLEKNKQESDPHKANFATPFAPEDSQQPERVAKECEKWGNQYPAMMSGDVSSVEDVSGRSCKQQGRCQQTCLLASQEFKLRFNGVGNAVDIANIIGKEDLSPMLKENGLLDGFR